MPKRPLRAALIAIGLAIAATASADAYDDAYKLLREGKAGEALALADAAIAAHPRDARMRFLKGVILSDQGRRAEAEAVFVALTVDFPELADPYNNLAVLYAGAGRLNEALVALQSALRNDPRHAAARENLGDVHLALAIEAWSAALTERTADGAVLLRKLQLAREILPKEPRASLPDRLQAPSHSRGSTEVREPR